MILGQSRVGSVDVQAWRVTATAVHSVNVRAFHGPCSDSRTIHDFPAHSVPDVVNPSSALPIPQAHLGQELLVVAILRFQVVWDADDSKPEYFSTKRETAMPMSFFWCSGVVSKRNSLRCSGKG